MYRVIKIINYAMTRHVILQNETSGTTIKCFDDSMVVSDVNFAFMEVDKVYDCKIRPFGDEVKTMEKETTLICKIVETNISIGARNNYVKLKYAEDEFYLSANSIKSSAIGDTIAFYYTRMDLIQVDDVIHADLLRKPLA